VQGQLGDKLISDLIREIAEKNSSGLLRITKGKMIKAIFFQGGAPKFAISNVAKDQLEQKLIKDGLVTAAQIEQAKKAAGAANQLGASLVEAGVLTNDLMRKVVSDQVMGIVLSLFEWDHGDYVFDERIRANHDVTLECSAVDVLLEGARHAAGLSTIAEALAPLDGIIVRPKKNGRTDSGKLMPVESYILSRIDSPTAISEVGSLSGIPEEQAHRAICALVAAGLLRLAGDEKEEEESTEKETNSIEQVREEVLRRLHFFTTADYYEMLEVTRQSTTADIKMAYYNLAKKFHPDRYHQLARDSELRSNLESLFSRLTQAYDTLRQPALRANYDDQLRKPTNKTTGALAQEPRIAERRPVEERKPTADTIASGEPSSQGSSNVKLSSNTQTGGAEATPVESHHNAAPNVGRTAEYYYQQGRARFDRKEYHAAVHLLREAVRIDPAKPQYHFHLGMALINNPRTRREAEQHLSKAAELDPYNANMRMKLGLVYKEAGLPKKAEHFFREVLSLDPSNRHALKELHSKKEEAGNIWKSDLGSIAKRIFKK
jgi:curved DNA-binding protein CbpA